MCLVEFVNWQNVQALCKGLATRLLRQASCSIGFGRVRSRVRSRVGSFKDFQDLFTGCIRCFGEVFVEWVHCLSAALVLTRASDYQTVLRLYSNCSQTGTSTAVCLSISSISKIWISFSSIGMSLCFNSPVETLHFSLKGVLPDSLGFSLCGSVWITPYVNRISALPQFRRCSMCSAAELLLAVGGHPTKFSARGLSIQKFF